MARGVNKVILVGNLGGDPEVRYAPNSNAVTTISVATSDSWKDKQTGEMQDRTEWHRVVLFGRLAEVAGEYLRKGAKVYVEGSIHTRKWQDKNGQDRYSTDIIASDMQMLDNKATVGANDSYGNNGNTASAASRATNKADSLPPSADLDDGFDGDIPF